MGSVAEIAKELNELNENIVLIYALNSTGKTRLSVAYKDLTKLSKDGNQKHAGVYYNAYSEDLFVWDNDEEHLNLKVSPSSLSKFHSFLIEDDERIRENLKPYFPKYDFMLNQHKKS